MAEVGRKGIEEVAASGILETALNVGATCPAFTLGDAKGDRVSSTALLAKGPVVIVFYRGAWCPYCNLYLHAWQSYLPKLAERSATLVAISGEPPDRTATVVQKTEATFTVLSDPGYLVSRQFGVVYEVPKGVAELMRSRGLYMKGYYGTGKAELPLSATYVVGRDGRITYAFLDADYKKRAEPADVLGALDALPPGRR
jgi:peroxiredoxin